MDEYLHVLGGLTWDFFGECVSFVMNVLYQTVRRTMNLEAGVVFLLLSFIHITLLESLSLSLSLSIKSTNVLSIR